MTQTEKDIFLKDLCMRLPYGVNMATSYGTGLLTSIRINDSVEKLGINIDPTLIRIFSADDVKPYLFPLSSITEEQKNELSEMEWSFDNSTICNIIECFGTYRAYVDHTCCSELIDWFIKNHIDYRGLIPMGLANDATGLNIY